jgi:small-conductance mechanosensitive channel
MLRAVGSALRRAPYAWLVATILVCIAPLRGVLIVVEGTDEKSMALTIGATALIAYFVAFALVLAPRVIYSKGPGEQHADEVAALRWAYAIAPVMVGYVGTVAGAEPWTSVVGAVASGLLLLLAARESRT